HLRLLHSFPTRRSSDLEAWEIVVLLFISLNFFVGVFNLLPLLPLDGGHIAIAWFERIRSWLFAKLGKPDPGRVDYFKLMPVTYRSEEHTSELQSRENLV